MEIAFAGIGRIHASYTFNWFHCRVPGPNWTFPPARQTETQIALVLDSLKDQDENVTSSDDSKIMQKHGGIIFWNSTRTIR